IPSTVRRRFSRLAGLLEIADNEFRRLRDELIVYAREVPKQIESAPSTVLLDDVSLASFIESNSELAAIDNQMAEVAGRDLRLGKWENLAAALNHVGLG